MSKKIIVDLLRHGEPEGGDVLRGRINHPLSQEGWRQMRASAAAADHSSYPWTEVISSPLQRCLAFADFLREDQGLGVDVREDWQEIDYGEWDGMQLKEWRVAAADQFSAFRSDLSKLVPPGGEAYLDFKSRVLAEWEAIASKADGSHVLVITHGGVMRVVLPTVLGMPLNRSFPLHIPFACLSRILLKVEESDGKIANITASFVGHNLARHS